MQKNIAILGSTGSIGSSTLSVIRHNPSLYKAYVLTGGSNVTKMSEQCVEFKPKYVAMADDCSARQLQQNLRDLNSNIDIDLIDANDAVLFWQNGVLLALKDNPEFP